MASTGAGSSNTEDKKIIVRATSPLPASFATKVERFFTSHMPPQFKLELQCTLEDQPPPKRRRVCMCPEGVPRGYMSEAPRPQLTGDDGLGGCPHCLCNPCVVSMPPDFLVGRGPPHLRNVEKRYTFYRKFWRMFTDFKLWGHPLYLTKKRAITSILDQREILPKCVVKDVRERYPNPPDLPYVGYIPTSGLERLVLEP